MSLLVLDASALLASAEDSPRGEALRAALPLLAEVRAPAAPALVAWEVLHVVHVKHPQRYGATLDRRAEAVETLLEDVALDVPDAAARRRTAELATRLGLSAYDASYLELAGRAAGSALVTEDADLRQAAVATLGRGRVAGGSDAGRLA